MRKATIVTAALVLLAGLMAGPAAATTNTAAWEAKREVKATALLPQAPVTTLGERDQKMGALPAQSTICAANGVGSAYPTLEYAVEKWNDASYGALHLSVLNRCDGYSITNRLTIEAYFDTTSTCGKFTQVGSVWNTTQGKYIYNQNPVIWVNLNDICAGSDTSRAHRFQMYVGYILGLYYLPVNNQVMGNTSTAVNNVKYVTVQDIRDMATVYGLTA